MMFEQLPKHLDKGCAYFMASDGSLHKCLVSGLEYAREEDDIQILATSPEEWRDYLRELHYVEVEWSLRFILTHYDRGLLACMGIAAWDADRRDQ
jgi:hypothetical protein